MSWLNKVKKFINEFHDTRENGGYGYFLIPHDIVGLDGIREWIEYYENTEEGGWFWWELEPAWNNPDFYVLMLHW